MGVTLIAVVFHGRSEICPFMVQSIILTATFKAYVSV